MASSERDPRFDVPLYTISEAAMHLRMSDETLRRWVNRGDLIRSLTPETPKSARLPFIAMAEAQFYLQLRRDGLSMQSVTTGMAAARQLLGARFLVRGALAHDGKDVLLKQALTAATGSSDGLTVEMGKDVSRLLTVGASNYCPDLSPAFAKILA